MSREREASGVAATSASTSQRGDGADAGLERTAEAVEELYRLRDTFFPRDPAEKPAALRARADAALAVLDSVPPEQRKSPQQRAVCEFLRGKILDVFPEYNKEAEDHLSKASIPGSTDTVDRAGFWESLGSCDCLRSHLKTLVLHGFQNLNQELLFLNYILEKGKMLKTLCIVRSEIDDFLAEACHVVPEVGPTSGFILERDAPSGGSSGSDISVCPASRGWSFQNAIDLSVKDPFYASRHDVTWIACRTEDESLCF